MSVGALKIDVYERTAFAVNAGITSHGQRNMQAGHTATTGLNYGCMAFKGQELEDCRGNDSTEMKSSFSRSKCNNTARNEA